MVSGLISSHRGAECTCQLAISCSLLRWHEAMQQSTSFTAGYMLIWCVWVLIFNCVMLNCITWTQCPLSCVMFELCYLIRSHTHHQSSPCLCLLYRSFIITSADGCTVAVIAITLRSTDGLPFDRCFEAYNTSSRLVFTLNQVTFAESRVTMEGDEGNNGDHHHNSSVTPDGTG